jgi:uncharacterized protein
MLGESVHMAIGDGLSFCVNISIRQMLSRYILFLQNFSYLPKDALSLKIKARALASQNEMIIRDTRVSKSYIEYDISIPDKREVREVANILRDIGAYASSYHVVDRKREKKEGVTEAITFFNEEKYWIAHEILESIWKGSRGVEKELLGGTILVCAAFVHFQKDEGEICISILTRALNKLKNVNGLYFRMDVDKLKDSVYNNIQNGKPEPFHI